MAEQYAYPFDPTGVATTNLVEDEQHIISIPEVDSYYFIVPFLGPFFEDGLVITHYPSGRVLVKGVDFAPAYQFISASRACAKPIYGAISIYDRTLSGNLVLSYQTLGGEWAINQTVAAELLSNALTNPRSTTWEQVVDLPYAFPVIDHQWNLIDLVGQTELVAAIDGVATTINQKATEKDALMWQYVRHLNAMQRARQWYKTSLTEGGIPIGTKIIDAAYDGVSTYVLVDDAGDVYFSTDGLVTVTKSVDDASVKTKSVCYGEGKFVLAPLAGEKFRTSPNGNAPWTVNDSYVAIDNLNKIRYVNGKFVAVGNNGRIVVSEDTVVWSAGITSVAENLHDIAYGDDKYIVIGNDTLFVSSDLITWDIPAAIPVLDDIKQMGIAYGNGMFIVVNGYNVYTSTNGLIWTTVPNVVLTKELTGIAFGYEINGLGVFMGVGVNAILMTTDGVHWIMSVGGELESFNFISGSGFDFIAAGDELSSVYLSMISMILVGGTRFPIRHP